MSDPEFEALLDRMAEEMESGEDDVPMEKHDWKVAREALFECDSSFYECGKCGAKLAVRADQSMNAAMEDHGVLPSCVEMAVKAIGEF